MPSPPAADPASGPDLAPLRAIVGDAHVLVDDDVRAGYEGDWTGRFVGRAAAVVRPASTDEVAAVLAWCSASGVAVVPQGGNTGLVGGSVPDGSGDASSCRCAGSTPSARSTPTPARSPPGPA